MSVTYGGFRFLVLWPRYSSSDRTAPPSSDIYGRLVIEGDDFPPSEFALSTASGQQFFPAAGFDGVNFLCAWNSGAGGPGSKIVFRQFDVLGLALRPEFSLFSATAPDRPLIAFPIFDGRRFFIAAMLGQVTPGAGDLLTSDLQGLFIGPPQISASPESFAAVAGHDVPLAVSAQGTGPLKYQWLRGGSDSPGPNQSGTIIRGATNASYTVTNMQLDDVGPYTVVVSNFLGAVQARSFFINIAYPPVITQQPQSVSNAVPGSLVIFLAKATGDDPLTYQWRLNGANIPGATNEAFKIPNVQPTDAGLYTFVVANGVGFASSTPAALTFNLPTLAGGDNFAGRIPLNGDAGSITANNLNASREIGRAHV